MPSLQCRYESLRHDPLEPTGLFHVLWLDINAGKAFPKGRRSMAKAKVDRFRDGSGRDVLVTVVGYSHTLLRLFITCNFRNLQELLQRIRSFPYVTSQLVRTATMRHRRLSRAGVFQSRNFVEASFWRTTMEPD